MGSEGSAHCHYEHTYAMKREAHPKAHKVKYNTALGKGIRWNEIPSGFVTLVRASTNGTINL